MLFQSQLIPIILFATLIFSCKNEPISDGQSTEGVIDRPYQISPSDLVGKTIEYKYGESIYLVHVDTDSTMHWEAVSGDEKGVKEDETYKIESIGNNCLFITWGEANGIGVSQVLDFENGIVHNHLLRGRDISIGRGEIRILNN